MVIFNYICRPKILETLIYMTISLPIYISLTSIFKNQEILYNTLESILEQSKLPDKIYLFLSDESYLLDDGFKDKIITNKNLLQLLKNNLFEIKWVENQGPYRKLLPLLKEKWNEDCLIITIDDDTLYNMDFINNIVEDYYIHNCVINYRGFTPKMVSLKDFDYHNRTEIIHKYLYNFPTGKGGILYKPCFFHKTGDLIFNTDIYMNTCKTADDVWFYLLRILNNIECFLDNKTWLKKDLTTRYGLCFKFNSNNNNTIFLRNTLEKLGHLF